MRAIGARPAWAANGSTNPEMNDVSISCRAADRAVSGQPCRSGCAARRTRGIEAASVARRPTSPTPGSGAPLDGPAGARTHARGKHAATGDQFEGEECDHCREPDARAHLRVGPRRDGGEDRQRARRVERNARDGAARAVGQAQVEPAAGVELDRGAALRRNRAHLPGPSVLPEMEPPIRTPRRVHHRHPTERTAGCHRSCPSCHARPAVRSASRAAA